MSKEKIKELEQEVKNLKQKLNKRYGLVWEEKEEFFDEKSKNSIPVLKSKNSKNHPNIATDIKNGAKPHILIEGDNYHTLSVLSYTHKNKIDVIYIDPPYNTGKEFIYNDKIVDTEDSFRHSKWLSFMNKRLKLARDLLTDDGVIFISIDDNEQAQLKLLCDEVFGEKNFITKFIWEKTQHFGRQKVNFYSNADYILTYAKKLKNINENKKELLVEKIKQEHEDAPLYNASNKLNILTFPAGSVYFNTEKGKFNQSENEKYKLLKPITVENHFNLSEIVLEFKSRWSQNTIDKEMANGTTFWVKSNGFAIRAIYNNDKESKESPKQILFTNKKNEFQTVSRFEDKVGTSEKGSNDLLSIIGNQNIFEYPKPQSLISYLLSLQFNKNINLFNNDSVILDFFAGSGTTGHAVLELNKQDNGNRQFILATNNENGICEDITYQRLKNVMQGYTTPKGKEVAGLGGKLQYLQTDFVQKQIDNEITDEDKINLTYETSTLLALKENTFNEIKREKLYQVFSSKTNITAIYFSENTIDLSELLDYLENLDLPVKLYLFSWGDGHFDGEFDNYTNIIIEDIPEPIFKIYQNLGVI